ncbi:Actin-like protein arp6 [Elsinoe australis]|uniref:Actin-like protein ARP6 n=1 Tax=Elsinoe australis TaxID=40998 RepID=A0A2P8AE61_9PEZI|nr:Actin-like protein arp6 [Elsinoe australis]
MQFKRPVERGYIVNWDLERAIFEHEFFDPKAKLYCDPASTNLILAETPNAPSALSSNADQIIFEEFSFATAYRGNGPSLNSLNPLPPSLSPSPPSPTAMSLDTPSPPSPLPIEIMLLIDTSHSHTTITPLLRGSPVPRAVRRLDIGGKHISNHLASLISLRHFSLIDEPHIVSQIKEDACFVSTDFAHDLDTTWRGTHSDRRVPSSDIVADYVLPDYEALKRGYMRRPGGVNPSVPSSGTTAVPPPPEREEAFPLSNERFAPPELLFSPLDVGLQQSGLPDTIMQSLSQVPEALWQGLLGNIVVVGGNALLPGFVERLEKEVRMLAPAELEVRVARATDPVGATWRGGRVLAGREEWLGRMVVGREEYFEYGEGWVRRQFAGRRWPLKTREEGTET